MNREVEVTIRHLAGLITLLAAGGWFVHATEEKIRVYVTNSESWEMIGGFYGNSSAVAGTTRGGARSQTVEIIKTLGEKCPEITVTIRKERANYILILDHEGGKGVARRDNKVAVFMEWP